MPPRCHHREVALPDKAEDGGIKRRNVAFPFGQSALPVFRLFIGDLGEYPGGGVVDDIVAEQVEVSVDARAHWERAKEARVSDALWGSHRAHARAAEAGRP